MSICLSIFLSAVSTVLAVTGDVNLVRDGGFESVTKLISTKEPGKWGTFDWQPDKHVAVISIAGDGQLAAGTKAAKVEIIKFTAGEAGVRQWLHNGNYLICLLRHTLSKN